MRKPVPRLQTGAKEAGDHRPASSAAAPEVPAPALSSGEQSEAFESAIALFHSGQFTAARTLFREAASGPNREMTHAALSHARMCERRIGAPPAPASAEERYNYAIALINERRFEAAEAQLRQALAQAPNGDHIHYALALCRGLSGDLAGAYTHIKRAIELHPRNRAVARNDADFADLAQRPPLADLLYPERARAD
jgi:tetratricopeptide (TPR) repeat protein